MEPSATAAHGFLKFVNASPSPFHAVDFVKKALTQVGFIEIREREDWTPVCQPEGKYYLTRNTSSILAFAVGKIWKPGNAVAMIGAHTDSPCLRIKPISKRQNEGFIQVGVETYGGGLWHTWFDRDLSIAGRVMIKTPTGGFVQKLVRVDRPILRIPTLAIHLDRQEPFAFDKETQLFPIAGLVAAELDGRTVPAPNSGVPEGPVTPPRSLKNIGERHHPHIVQLIASEAAVKPEDIVDFEMVLYDTQKSCVGGLNNEFIFSPRLDNLAMSYCSVGGFIDSLASPEALSKESSIRLVSLFDNEEIGSDTAQGAGSNLLPAVLRRLSSIPGKKNTSISASAYEQTVSASFLVSADMAHAVHPNYADKHEKSHRPKINEGTVIKINANARYATNSPGIVFMQEVAHRANVPLQLFVVGNGSPCGSTIGPMLAASLGVRTIDLGNPQLSMHSIRETGGVRDFQYAVELFQSFFEHFSELEKKIFVD